MKTILFYLHFTKIGGVEKVAMHYMQGLVDNGFKVDLIVDFDMGKDGNTFEYAIPKEVSIKYIKSERITKFIYWLRTMGKKNKFFNILLYGFMILFDFYYYHTKVKNIVQNGNYDWTISFYQFLPAYLTNIKSSKHIIWLHGSVEHFFEGITKIFKNSYGKKLDKYDLIITITDEMKIQLENFYLELSKNKIKRIYNPFDFKDIQNKSVDFTNVLAYEKELLKDKYICTVSRLDENHKDIITLINAYKKLYYEKLIAHKLYIIGDGPDKTRLLNIVNDYNLSEQILFFGKKLNPYIWMTNADIFVLSSKTEGFGLVLVEAMAVETFVISSNCKTGPREILEYGKCGDLFEVGNVNELSQKIEFVLCNEKYKNIKITNAYNEIKRFDKKQIIKEFEMLLLA